MKRPFFLLTLLLVLVWWAPVWGHTQLLLADPPPGAKLATSPTTIRLTFSEPNSPESTIQLFGANFQTINGIENVFDPTAPQQMVALLPPLETGVYTVQWKTVSLDGHQLQGSYSFEVNRRSVINRWVLGTAVGLAICLLILAGIRRWWKPPSLPPKRKK